MAPATTAPTLLTAIQPFTTPDSLPTHSSTLHPFAAPSAFTSSAHDTLTALIDSTTHLSHSLSVYLSIPLSTSNPSGSHISNPKLISLLKQHSQLLAASHTSSASALAAARAFRAHSARHGPADDTSAPFGERVERIAKSAGMEVSREGEGSVVCWGGVVVVDIDLTKDNEKSLIQVKVKTSFAVASSVDHAGNTISASNSTGPSGSAANSTVGSPSLDTLLSLALSSFSSPNPPSGAGAKLRAILRYLMHLDVLSAKNSSQGGERWFTDVDALAIELGCQVGEEASRIAKSLSASNAPVDIYLLRSHLTPLALPHILAPAISFMIHMSPAAYLTLKKSNLSPGSGLDVNTRTLCQFIMNMDKSQMEKGDIVLATLLLVPAPPAPTATFTTSSAPEDRPLPQASGFIWVLDFSFNPLEDVTDVTETSNGGEGWDGVVMSQGRMRALEAVLFGQERAEGHSMGIGIGEGRSWVDMLLNPNIDHTSHPRQQRYTALHRSPNGLHPPLHMRLTTPPEPGFVLRRLPVTSLAQVCRVIEVVREQCWLSGILRGIAWVPESSPEARASDDTQKDADADAQVTDAELAALLEGRLPPRELPVNVYVPPTAWPPPCLTSSFSLAPAPTLSPSLSTSFSQPSLHPQPMLVLTAPERPPISGLVEIGLAHALAEPRGCRVDVAGASLGIGMGTGMGGEKERLAEVVRRGGAGGLPGRVWVTGGLGNT